MKKKSVFLLLSLLSLCQTAAGYVFERGGIYYGWTNTNRKAVEVTYMKDNGDGTYSSPYRGTVVVPAEVEYGGKTYPVEAVGSYAFANCQEELDSIILSEGITELSGNAFYNCGVRYLNIPSSVYLMRRNPFVRCPRLEEVVIEDSYFPLPLPENLSGSEEMMEGLFHSCPALKRVYIGRTLDYDASEQYGPFHGLTNLEEVTIGEEVEELDQNLFAGCTGLKTVYYNAYSAEFSHTHLNRSPFGKGSAVEQMIVGESVRNIPTGFCKNNTSLRSVTVRPHDFPNLRTFGTEAFSGCTQLEEVHIEDLAGWCSATFASESANPLSPGADLYVNGELVRTLQIPDSTYIQSYAFAGCTSVEEILIPASVRSVYSGAFAECTSLRKLVVEGDLTIMGADFLSGCTALEELYFMGAPSSYNFMAHVPDAAAVYALPSEARRIEDVWDGRVIEFGPEVSLKKRYLAAIVFSVANHCPEGMDVRIDRVTFDGEAAEPTEGDSLYRIDGLEPETWHEVVVYYTAYGKEYTYSTELKTEYLSVSLYGAETGQCHIAFDDVLASSDETMQPGRKGVVFNSTNYPIEEDGIRFDNLVPGRQYTFTPYAVYDGKTYYGGEYKYATKGVSPRISILQTGPTSVVCKGEKTLSEATLGEEWFTIEGTDHAGDSLSLAGLEPQTRYTVSYTVTTAEGSTETATATFTTSALELTTLQPKGVSETCSVVAVSTNIAEEETGVGFQWRKYDAPESLPSSEGYGAIYGGRLEGYIRNLQPTSYYNVRAFYKSAAGTYHYGDWVTFDPSDFSYFDPTVHTYPAGSVTPTSAAVRGYVLAGTDEIEEQGFEYRPAASPAAAPQRTAALPATAPETGTVPAEGQVMQATIEGLQPGTEYIFRAFARTAAATVYGEEQRFTTAPGATGTGRVELPGAEEPEITGYYSPDGRAYDSPRKGLNIVRYSDGSARKIIVP